MGHPAGNAPRKREYVQLPPRPFLYTVDQLAEVLNLTPQHIKSQLLWYEGREIGVRPRDELRAVNIAGEDDKPEWRVSEQELIRWLKRKGFKFYERAWVE
jgi:hypothetical protein